MIPVLVKELRTRMRGWRTPAVLTGYLCVLGLVCFLVLQYSLGGNSFNNAAATRVGVNLFDWLSVLQLVLIIFVTPATFSTAISGERQRQTLDLLLVTRLTSLGITMGKLIAAVAFDLLLLICSLPVFSLVFLFGGVGPDHVIEVFLLLVMVVLSFGSLGMLVSVLSRRANASTVVTYLLVLLAIPGLALVTIYLAALNYALGPDGSSLPFTAYLDPGFGLFALLLNPEDGSSALNFPFAVWEATMLVEAVTTVVCVALCAALLRRQRA